VCLQKCRVAQVEEKERRRRRHRKKVEEQFEIREGGEYERKLKETVD
jgi:hypothetical protein